MEEEEGSVPRRWSKGSVTILNPLCCKSVLRCGVRSVWLVCQCARSAVSFVRRYARDVSRSSLFPVKNRARFLSVHAVSVGRLRLGIARRVRPTHDRPRGYFERVTPSFKPVARISRRRERRVVGELLITEGLVQSARPRSSHP